MNCVLIVLQHLLHQQQNTSEFLSLRKITTRIFPTEKVEEEQEADVEDVSEEESESKEGTNKDFAQNAVRQRSVGPSLATDKSQLIFTNIFHMILAETEDRAFVLVDVNFKTCLYIAKVQPGLSLG